MKTATTKQTRKLPPRIILMSTPLYSGRTMQQLYEGWGFRFDAGGWLVMGKTGEK